MKAMMTSKRQTTTKIRPQQMQEEARQQEKRSASTRREEREETTAIFTLAGDWLEVDVSSLGASSSGQAAMSVNPPDGAARGAEKRELNEKEDDDEMPEESQKISNACIGYGASDKVGEANCQKEYEDYLKRLLEEYRARNDAGSVSLTSGRNTLVIEIFEL